ncbi:MAG: lamin tail domain-containing protein, partial [Planctomycetota bacterium]|jgi:hypothetical protein
LVLATQTLSTQTLTAQTQGIVINEFLTSNKTGIKDEKGQVEDWLELYNTTNSSVNVGGMYLTDDVTTPTEWQIPTNTMIAAGGTLLIWLDNDPLDGPLHATFKLTSLGEAVFLFDKDGKTRVDSFTFGKQVADVSTGRLTDGGSQWVTFGSPSPKSLNAPAVCGTRSFSALDSTAHRMTMSLTGSPKVNGNVTFGITNGPLSGGVLLFLSGAPSSLDLGAGVTLLLKGPLVGPLPLATNTLGSVSLPLSIPNDAKLAGAKVYLQAGGADTIGLTATNVLELTICP